MLKEFRLCSGDIQLLLQFVFKPGVRAPAWADGAGAHLVS